MTVDRARYKDMFKAKMSAFISDLKLIVGGSSVRSEVLALEAMVNMGSAWPVLTESFYRLVTVPYGNHILQGDVQFFLEKSYDGEVSNVSLVDTLKRLWSSSCDDDKAAIINHMKVLVAVSRQIFQAATSP